MILSFLSLESALMNSTFVVLFLTTLFYWIKFFFSTNEIFQGRGFYGLVFSNFLITIELIIRWISSGHFPLSNLYESLLFLNWGLLCLSILLEIQTKLDFLGLLISPITLCILGFTGFILPPELQQSQPLVPALQSNWLFMHVSIMMLSYSCLLLGCIFAITFLTVFFSVKMQNKVALLTPSEIALNSKNKTVYSSNVFEQDSKTNDITKKELKTFFSVENLKNFLELLDSLSYRTIGLGFCCLTLGILSGAVWANETWGNYWSWDPKETWALITWLTFASYLHTRLIGGWTGLNSAWIASFGFFIIWICYLGVNLLGQGLHSYGFLQI